MMETLKTNNHIEILEQLGEGSFSNQKLKLGKIFRALDKLKNKEYAIKVEKEEKNKKILHFEYGVLKDLQSNYFNLSSSPICSESI